MKQKTTIFVLLASLLMSCAVKIPYTIGIDNNINSSSENKEDKSSGVQFYVSRSFKLVSDSAGTEYQVEKGVIKKTEGNTKDMLFVDKNTLCIMTSDKVITFKDFEFSAIFTEDKVGYFVLDVKNNGKVFLNDRWYTVSFIGNYNPDAPDGKRVYLLCRKEDLEYSKSSSKKIKGVKVGK